MNFNDFADSTNTPTIRQQIVYTVREVLLIECLRLPLQILVDFVIQFDFVVEYFKKKSYFLLGFNFVWYTNVKAMYMISI